MATGPCWLWQGFFLVFQSNMSWIDFLRLAEMR